MNKKVWIFIAMVLVIIGIVVGVICYNKRTTDTEKEVIEIINNLNSGKGEYGDWQKKFAYYKCKRSKKNKH